MATVKNIYECVSGISETDNETENEIQLSTNGFNKWDQQIIYHRDNNLNLISFFFFFNFSSGQTIIFYKLFISLSRWKI